MDNKIKLSYFYGKEAEQYSFYKIPKLLFTDSYFKSLSVESKVLYGLMLDRMSLSVKNQWLDSEGRAYIYFSLEDAMDAFVCSNKKAISIMKELDSDTGIGLIEKKRQGQGKPTIIYVKQFYLEEVQKCKNFTSGENGVVSEVNNIHILKCKTDTSRSEEITGLEVKKVHTNKNNINNTKESNTESNLILSVAPCDDLRVNLDSDTIRSDVDAYAELIRENLDLDILKERYPYDHELLDGIFDLILETVLCQGESIVIASNKYSTNLVKGKLLKLNSMHIEYAMDCLKKTTTDVRNIKKYLLATLFNAPSTISGYYQQQVNHDMPELAAR